MSFFIMLSTFKECYQNSSHVLKTKKVVKPCVCFWNLVMELSNVSKKDENHGKEMWKTKKNKKTSTFKNQIELFIK